MASESRNFCWLVPKTLGKAAEPRRVHFMGKTSTILMFIAAFGTLQAQSWRPPSESERCPSKWGAGDQRGSGNLMKPDVVLKAAKLIKTGEVIELGFPLNSSMPFFGDRHLEIITKRTNV